MRFFIIPAMFVALLFLPSVSLAETVEECQKNCSTDLAASIANCPPTTEEKDTDQTHKKCLQDVQNALRACHEVCRHAASMEAPVDTPADETKDSLQDRLTSTPPVAPPESPKEMPQDTPPDAPR
jgi:hypothetical protein